MMREKQPSGPVKPSYSTYNDDVWASSCVVEGGPSQRNAQICNFERSGGGAR